MHLLSPRVLLTQGRAAASGVRGQGLWAGSCSVWSMGSTGVGLWRHLEQSKVKYSCRGDLLLSPCSCWGPAAPCLFLCVVEDYLLVLTPQQPDNSSCSPTFPPLLHLPEVFPLLEAHVALFTGFTLAWLAQACVAGDHTPRSCSRCYRKQREKTMPMMLWSCCCLWDEGCVSPRILSSAFPRHLACLCKAEPFSG